MVYVPSVMTVVVAVYFVVFIAVMLFAMELYATLLRSYLQFACSVVVMFVVNVLLFCVVVGAAPVSVGAVAS